MSQNRTVSGRSSAPPAGRAEADTSPRADPGMSLAIAASIRLRCPSNTPSFSRSELGKIRQRCYVNRVLTKCLFVLLQPKVAQPGPNIHVSLLAP